MGRFFVVRSPNFAANCMIGSFQIKVGFCSYGNNIVGLAHLLVWFFLSVFGGELWGAVAEAEAGAGTAVLATLNDALGTYGRLATASRLLLPLVLGI